MNKRIIRLISLVSVLFVVLVVYMTVFQVFLAEDLANNSYNQRLSRNDENKIRGSIYDRNENILAYTDGEDKDRYYEYPHIYSHMIGYYHPKYGKAGLESAFNNSLLNINEKNTFNKIKDLLSPEEKGNDLYLTINHQLQLKAYSLLEGHKGSIVLLNYKTGDVLAMAERPTFNPMYLDDEWDELLDDEESPLLNRSTQGLYTPGSSFKVITAASILENLSKEEQDYYDEGETIIDGYKIKNYENEVYGEIDLKSALVNSVNTYFADKGIEVGEKALLETSENFMLNKSIPFDIPIAISEVPFGVEKGLTETAAASFGQGKTLVTPMQMALISAAIANDGQMVKPILVEKIVSPDGEIINEAKTEILIDSLDYDLAQELKEDMVAVVDAGSRAEISGWRVGGKTGTAETTSGLTHAWFIAFLEEEDLPLAVAIVLEEDGTLGGRAAAPKAKEIFEEAIYINY